VQVQAVEIGQAFGQRLALDREDRLAWRRIVALQEDMAGFAAQPCAAAVRARPGRLVATSPASSGPCRA
jgi:hypothetical protein